MDSPAPLPVFGKGKVDELVAARSETGYTLLVADDELSPAQQRALEEAVKTKVIDRSRLILDIGLTVAAATGHLRGRSGEP